MTDGEDSTLPLVSIGCGVYNGADTLRRALDGVVAQDYPRLEILVFDDGSTDESRAICREYAARDRRIRYEENPANLGLIGNFNKLFRESKGKYFMWADQDDVRAPTFVSKCVEIMESDPETVLCHSHTGVFYRSFERLMHVNTLDQVDDQADVLARYWRFLRAYSDTAIYGLIRSDALRRTHLWRRDLGSSNVLLFQLLLQGKFRQVPETLYYYAAKGKRPTPAEEYRRANGRPMPRYVVPFLVVAFNQARDIVDARLTRPHKALLLTELAQHLLLVNGAKAAFRTARAVRRGDVPRWLERACEAAIADTRDIHYVVRPEEDPEYYRAGAPLQ